MRISLKNHVKSDLDIKNIVVSLENIEQILFRLPEGWMVNFSKESNSMTFSNSNSLPPNETIDLKVRSKLLSEGTYSACMNADGDTVYLTLCK